MSLCMFVLRLVFNTFIEEKICSTLPLENGKLNANSHRLRTLDHFGASGQEYNFYHTLWYLVRSMSKYVRAYSTASSTSSWSVAIETPLASRGSLKCVAM